MYLLCCCTKYLQGHFDKKWSDFFPDCCQCVDTMVPTDCSDDGSETWSWRSWDCEGRSTGHWEHKTVFLWSQRAPWLHSAELQLTLTLSYWDQSGAGHELNIMRTPVIVTVRILQRMTEVLCQCHVSGSPFNPTLGSDLGEAGAWDPLLTAAEVPGLAEAPRPRLPSPPASIEDADLSILASKTRPFALPAKDK